MQDGRFFCAGGLGLHLSAWKLRRSNAGDSRISGKLQPPPTVVLDQTQGQLLPIHGRWNRHRAFPNAVALNAVPYSLYHHLSLPLHLARNVRGPRVRSCSPQARGADHSAVSLSLQDKLCFDTRTYLSGPLADWVDRSCTPISPEAYPEPASTTSGSSGRHSTLSSTSRTPWSPSRRARPTMTSKRKPKSVYYSPARFLLLRIRAEASLLRETWRIADASAKSTLPFVQIRQMLPRWGESSLHCGPYGLRALISTAKSGSSAPCSPAFHGGCINLRQGLVNFSRKFLKPASISGTSQ